VCVFWERRSIDLYKQVVFIRMTCALRDRDRDRGSGTSNSSHCGFLHVWQPPCKTRLTRLAGESCCYICVQEQFMVTAIQTVADSDTLVKPDLGSD
jgi:hypothetical protein